MRLILPLQRVRLRRLSVQMVKALSINNNGVGESIKRCWIRSLVRDCKAIVLFLQETHVQSLDSRSMRECWGNDHFEHCVSKSVG